MAHLKILICGGGCGGPALAFWLAKLGHDITIVERFPALRASGAQIDLRAQAISVVKRMGLLDQIKAVLVDEPGTSYVDSAGNVVGSVMANTSGKGAQSVTSEYEIMRGDLVRIMHENTKDNVKYVFGKTVERFEQDEHKVIAYFSDGQQEDYDVLVGADGQGSRVRKAIQPPHSPDPYRRSGFYFAYFFIPRTSEDSNMRKIYFVPNGWIMIRSHNKTEAQVYFLLIDDDPEIQNIPRASIETQKEFFASRFKNLGWWSNRCVEGMWTTKNWYCQEVLQVVTDTWSKGRVVLLGDAAHCPSPMSGFGTTSAFVGAYVLAGAISQHSDDLSRAFAEYDRVLRPLVTDLQVDLSKRRWLFPTTWAMCWVLRLVCQAVCFLRIPDLVSRLTPEEKGGWQLPEYPELHTEKGL